MNKIKNDFFVFVLDEIYSLSLATSLPTLPFEVFKQLLDFSPLTTDDGVLLRRMVIEVGAMHLVLNCLGIFTHHSQVCQLTGLQAEVICILNFFYFKFVKILFFRQRLQQT